MERSAGSGNGGKRGARVAGLAVLATLAGGCATVGSTLGSGVGDALMDRPPYVAGARGTDGLPVAHLPVAYQRGASQAPIFDPDAGPGSPVAALLAEMNDDLDSLGGSVPLPAVNALPGTPPDVRFGCEQSSPGECESDSEEISVQGSPWMRLEVGRPSRGWTLAVAEALAGVGAGRVLVLTLEVGQYWPHQRNLRGDKEVRLGPGYSERLPWLTALDRPVQVLQLTGALVEPDGRVLRIAAEGLLARPTHLLAGSLGAQALIGEAEVERLRSLRREDLPGRPLVWQEALRNLVAELTGGSET